MITFWYVHVEVVCNGPHTDSGASSAWDVIWHIMSSLVGHTQMLVGNWQQPKSYCSHLHADLAPVTQPDIAARPPSPDSIQPTSLGATEYNIIRSAASYDRMKLVALMIVRGYIGVRSSGTSS